MTGDRNINLLTGALTSAAPATLTDATLGTALPYLCDQAIVCLRNSAGTGVVSAIAIVWAFQPELARWFNLGPLNGGAAIAEVSAPADTLAYAQGVAGLRGFNRLYLELGTLSGTGTAITADAICIRAEPTTTS